MKISPSGPSEVWYVVQKDFEQVVEEGGTLQNKRFLRYPDTNPISTVSLLLEECSLGVNIDVLEASDWKELTKKVYYDVAIPRHVVTNDSHKYSVEIHPIQVVTCIDGTNHVANYSSETYILDTFDHTKNNLYIHVNDQPYSIEDLKDKQLKHFNLNFKVVILFLSQPKTQLINLKSQPGIMGLANIGNTCYLNAALQCLSKIDILTNFFLSGDYLKDLNCGNRIGTGGKLAHAYAQLCEAMYDSKTSSFAPRELKQILGVFNEQFAGYRQQDSQEVLLTLLDGLHEDLNRVQVRPVSSCIDEADLEKKSDKWIADESWMRHKARNDSFIVDSFQGQYRSRLECVNCKHAAVVFDPFMSLTLPIPDNNVLYSKVILYFYDNESIVEIATCYPESAGTRLYDLVYSTIKSRFKLNDPLNEKSLLLYVENSDSSFIPYNPTTLSTIKPNTIYLISLQPSWLCKYIHEGVKIDSAPDWFNPPIDFISLISLIPQDQYVAIPIIFKKGMTSPYIPHNMKNLILDTEYLESLNLDTNTHDAPQLGTIKTIPTRVLSTQDNITHPNNPAITLHQCIEDFLNPETLSNYDSWYCPKCKTHVSAIKKIDLYRLPDILILHLKRFQSSFRGLRSKKKALVRFPHEEVLDLGAYVLKSGEKKSYFLESVICHSGELSGGHYTAKVKCKDTWVEFDDSHVIRDDSVGDIETAAAYVLIYQSVC